MVVSRSLTEMEENGPEKDLKTGRGASTYTPTARKNDTDVETQMVQQMPA